MYAVTPVFVDCVPHAYGENDIPFPWYTSISTAFTTFVEVCCTATLFDSAFTGVTACTCACIVGVVSSITANITPMIPMPPINPMFLVFIFFVPFFCRFIFLPGV